MKLDRELTFVPLADRGDLNLLPPKSGLRANDAESASPGVPARTPEPQPNVVLSPTSERPSSVRFIGEELYD